MEERQLLAFQDELQKLGGVPGALARFGQRQVHSLTGWAPKGGLEAMRMAPSEAATSLPGFVRSVGQKGLLPSIAAGAKNQLSGSNLAEKALMVGLPAAGLASAIKNPASPNPNVSKEENIGRQAGGLVGGLAAGPMPFAGSVLMGEAFGQAGALAGRGVHKVRSLLNPQNGLHPHGPFASQSTDLTGESGQAAPSEKIVTDRAAGTHGSTL